MPLLTGRRPRTHDPRVPHLSALRMLKPWQALPPIPLQLDYSRASGRLPEDLGMMLNDSLGCCTSAGCYHARQVWTDFAGGAVDTEPDADVLAWYRECSGYDGTPATDVGCVEQDVLRRWVNEGMPVSDNASHVDRLVAFVEIDPRHLDDVRRAVYDCGVVYVGFEVPDWLLAHGLPGPVWDYLPGHSEGGHCVVAVGYGDGYLDVVSWGRRYRMTDAFWRANVDEAYALVSRSWVTAHGTTPLGVPVEELERQVAAFCAD